ncbi:DUF4157 domain-containing protein [Actinomadura sp. 3N508]|uniref:DUF4157 domain-containing protein n=1 Tax=Actinomadura sp. 3N508 TaxID=3375153 RepID=UPI0037BA141B
MGHERAVEDAARQQWSARPPARQGNDHPVHRLLTPRPGGMMVPDATRGQAERAFGHDFSNVRVHADPESRAAVAGVGAVAATRGTDIMLGPGAPDLASAAGRRMLWHELTHVVQQGRGREAGETVPQGPASGRGLLSTPGDVHERQADEVAAGRLAPASVTPGPAPAVQLVGPTPTPAPPVSLPPWLQPTGASGPVTLGGQAVGNATEVMTVNATEAAGEAAGEAVLEEIAAARAPLNVAGRVLVGGQRSLMLLRVTTGIGRALPYVGLPLLGLVIQGSIILVIDAALRHAVPKNRPGEEYQGTSQPGGAPPPKAIAPGAAGPPSVKAPSGSPEGPARAPGPDRPPAAKAPGAAGPTAVRAPGVVKFPDECLRLIKAGTTHDHHLFPWEYVHEFADIWIWVDDYTVTLDWDKHIGRKGLHIVLDWNREWGEFFDQVPNDLTDSERAFWCKEAFKFAQELMIRAGISSKDVHVYRRKDRPSPVQPPTEWPEENRPKFVR